MFQTTAFSHIPCPEFQLRLCNRPFCLLSHGTVFTGDSVPDSKYLSLVPQPSPTPQPVPVVTQPMQPNVQVNNSILSAIASALGQLQAPPQYQPVQPYNPYGGVAYTPPVYGGTPQYQQPLPLPQYQPPSYMPPMQQSYTQPTPQIQQIQAQLQRIQSQLRNIGPGGSSDSTLKKPRLADHLQQLQGASGIDHSFEPDTPEENKPAPKVKSIASDTKFKRKVTMSEQLKGKGAKSSLPTPGLRPGSGGSIIPSRTKKEDKGKEKMDEKTKESAKGFFADWGPSDKKPAEAAPPTTEPGPPSAAVALQRNPPTAGLSPTTTPTTTAIKPAKPSVAPTAQQRQQQQQQPPQIVAVKPSQRGKPVKTSLLGRSQKMQQLQKLTQTNSIVQTRQLKELEKQKRERKRLREEAEVNEAAAAAKAAALPISKKTGGPQGEQDKYARAKAVLAKQLAEEKEKADVEKKRNAAAVAPRKVPLDPALIPAGGATKTKKRKIAPTTEGSVAAPGGAIPMAKPRRLIKLRNIEAAREGEKEEEEEDDEEIEVLEGQNPHALPSAFLQNSTMKKAKQREQMRKRREKYNYLTNSMNNNVNNGANRVEHPDVAQQFEEKMDEDEDILDVVGLAGEEGPGVGGGGSSMYEQGDGDYEALESQVEGRQGVSASVPTTRLFDLRKVDSVLKVIPLQNHPVIEFDMNARVAKNLRQQSLEKLLEEIMRQHYLYLHARDARHVVSADGHCYHCQKRAITEAVNLEKKLYQECKSKAVYLNLCAKAMLGLRERRKAFSLDH